MKLGEIARRIGAQMRGDAEYELYEIAPLADAGPHQLSFLASAKHQKYLEKSQAGALILSHQDATAFAGNVLLSSNPYAAYAHAAQMLYPVTRPEAGISPKAIVDPDARLHDKVRIEAGAIIAAGVTLAEGVWVGPGVVMESGCRVGRDTRIHANAVLYGGTIVGERCIIHAGAVIGADGFGFAPDKGRYVKIPQLGIVCIGDDVEIGANTAIDRGALENTVIAEGVKLDNLVQVAHNVHIGAHTVIAGQTGIAGSTQIGSHCMFGGQVGIVGHVRIADHVVVSGKSMVTRGISKPGIYSSGLPVQENAVWHKTVARLRKLDALQKRLEQIELSIKQLQEHE